jgi:arginyl-tRNA synthetase
MNLEEELSKRFAKAINDAIKPPILIGAKWLQACPSGQPADFQFTGVPKIAKATGRPKERIAPMLLKRMDLSDLRLRAEVTPTGLINIFSTKRKAPPGGAESSPPTSPPGGPGAARQGPTSAGSVEPRSGPSP